MDEQWERPTFGNKRKFDREKSPLELKEIGRPDPPATSLQIA